MGREEATEEAKGRKRTLWVATVLALAFAAQPFEARAVEALPDGWGAARFLMSAAQVREHFPEAKEVHRTDNADEESSNLPVIVLLRVEGQSDSGFDGCRVGFRFADDQLFFIELNCEQPPNRVLETLTARFGETSLKFPDKAAYWTAEESAVSINLRNGRYGYFHKELDAAVQKKFQAALFSKAPAR